MKIRSKTGAAHRPRAGWPPDVMQRAASMVVDEGINAQRVARELHIPYTTVSEWARKYRVGGIEALPKMRTAPNRPPKRAKPDPRREAVIAVKREQPQAGSALVRERTHGNHPAALAILRCVYEGAQVPFDRGMEIEARLFAQCLASPVAANTIRTMFVGLNEIKRGSGRPPQVAAASWRRIGVLGAGMMGSGIAYAAAARGIDVVLKDVDRDTADRGRRHAEKVLSRRVEKGELTRADADLVLQRIVPTSRVEDLAGCELIIEAVPEDRALKEAVIRESEQAIPLEAIMASNTSTLPITGLAVASLRPSRFLGLHFFSPVDRMPLVEIIRTRETSPDTLAHAFDFVRALGKIPIVVNDGRGFYTSRVFASYVNAGLGCLADGVSPALIENAGRMAGMPVGPLAVADEVSLDLIHQIGVQTDRDLGRTDDSAAASVIRLLVEQLDRRGRKAGKGFYDYGSDGTKTLWMGLREHFPLSPSQPPLDMVKRRLLHAQAVEAARAFEEGIVSSARDGDVGSILGWGFAPWTGGVFSYMDTIGISRFLRECEELEKAHGRPYAAPALLHEMARRGASFHGLTDRTVGHGA